MKTGTITTNMMEGMKIDLEDWEIHLEDQMNMGATGQERKDFLKLMKLLVERMRKFIEMSKKEQEKITNEGLSMKSIVEINKIGMSNIF